MKEGLNIFCTPPLEQCTDERFRRTKKSFFNTTFSCSPEDRLHQNICWPLILNSRFNRYVNCTPIEEKMSPNAISNILSVSDVSEKSRGRLHASMKSGKFTGNECKFANCLTKSDQKVCNFLYEQHISMKNSRNCYSAQFFEYFSSIFCMKK